MRGRSDKRPWDRSSAHFTQQRRQDKMFGWKPEKSRRELRESERRMHEHNWLEHEAQTKQRIRPREIVHVGYCEHCNEVTHITTKGIAGVVTKTRKHKCPGPMVRSRAISILRKEAPWVLRMWVQSPNKSVNRRGVKLYETDEDLRRMAIRALRGKVTKPTGWFKEGKRWVYAPAIP